MEACSPWLRLELEETQPQVIVALGGTAISWFLPKMKLKGKVGDYVGKDFGKYADGGHIHHAGVAVIGSYHPAALSPVQRATIRGVLEQAAEMVGIQIERAPEEVVDYAVEAW